MDAETLKNLQTKLESEKSRLEEELGGLGHKFTANGDWVATPEEGHTGFLPDNQDNADQVEEYQERVAMLSVLEQEYNDVMIALKKMEEGSYGTCEVSGEMIEAARLEANPTARTCMAHMDKN
jgi:RNA polymerase-binding transcription factor DksA